MVYAGLSYSRPRTLQIALAIFLLAFCAFITLYYHYLQDPTFHQNVYAALTVFIVFRAIWEMEYTLRPSLRKSTEEDRVWREQNRLLVLTKEQQRYENERDLEILKNMWILVAFGVSIFLGGFGIWALDRVFCSRLRLWRRNIGLPWGIFLEGHGWWHLMTGLGAYCYIVWGIWLRHVLNKKQEQYHLVWPRIYRLPEVVRVKEDPVANGSVEHVEVKKSK
jgi:dihydroceramidase